MLLAERLIGTLLMMALAVFCIRIAVRGRQEPLVYVPMVLLAVVLFILVVLSTIRMTFS